MKKMIFLFLFSMLFSCNKKEKFTVKISQNPKMIFNGTNIIDKNRNDSVVCYLNNKINIQKKSSFTKEFKLKPFLISNQNLKINKINIDKNRNQFSTYECLGLDILVSKDKIIGSPTTYNIEYKNNTTTTLIVEFKFKTEKDLLNAYTKYYNYTTFLRNLRRDKYQFRCCELFDEMFYYCVIKGNKLFFISDLYNYSFPEPKYNIESEVAKNNDIVMDNLYKTLNEK